MSNADEYAADVEYTQWCIDSWGDCPCGFGLEQIDRCTIHNARLREVSPEVSPTATVADVSMSLSKGHGDE